MVILMSHASWAVAAQDGFSHSAAGLLIPSTFARQGMHWRKGDGDQRL